jgi:hypothetical protein
MAKLSRRQIKEGLDQVPIDTILLGVGNRVETKLTPKQREFARQVALGETKAEAYRKAYNSKTQRKQTQGDMGYRLAARPDISAEIEAYRLAAEAEKQRTPAQLRALVIHQLTKHALDEACPPAQRIKALELLGKVSEVAAFTERKETTVINQSGELKQKLLDQLKNVVDITPKDDADDSADSLLAELHAIPHAGEIFEDGVLETHPPGTPLDEGDGQGDNTHNVPHKQIHANSVSAKPSLDDGDVDDVDPSPLSNGEVDTPLPYLGREDVDPTPSNGEDPPGFLGDKKGEGVSHPQRGSEK